jgi:phage-related protein
MCSEPTIRAQRHKAGHFSLGNVYFFATEIGLINIGNDIIVESHRLGLREVFDAPDLSPSFQRNQI